MRRRHGRVSRWLLLVLAVVCIGAYAVQAHSARYRRARFYEQKLEAARLAKRAFGVVAGFQGELGIPIDTVNDPNASGLVGLQYSQLTYGRSDLSDALATTNPNFSAAIYELLYRAGARRGDTVGVSWDGTYPALNIQVLAVLATMEVPAVIITSQSSGMWGANYPGMTWLDIERVLRGAGLWDYRSRFCTLGGEGDDGRGLSPEGRAELAAAAESVGVECFVPDFLAQAVERRLAAFRGCRAIVSVGRVSADIGDPFGQVPSRLLLRQTARIPETGVIAAALAKRVPVVFLGNPSRVAQDYGLPVVPVPMQEIGKGRLFFVRRYSVGLAVGLLLAVVLLLFVVVRYDVESHLMRRSGPEQEAV